MNSEPPNETVLLVKIKNTCMERHELEHVIVNALNGIADEVEFSMPDGTQHCTHLITPPEPAEPLGECEHGTPYRYYCEECD